MEIMAVVAIVGILAALAFTGYRRWIRYARTGETKDLINTLSHGQDRYFKEFDGYLSCSGGYNDYYPMPPNSKKHHFHNPAHADHPCFKLLAPGSNETTYMSFAVLAAAAGQSIPPPPATQVPFPSAPQDRPWYVIFAAGDQDENGVYQYLYTTSLQPGEIHVENDYE
jgi:Tfp pilus assembly protein PilE